MLCSGLIWISHIHHIPCNNTTPAHSRVHTPHRLPQKGYNPRNAEASTLTICLVSRRLIVNNVHTTFLPSVFTVTDPGFITLYPPPQKQHCHCVPFSLDLSTSLYITVNYNWFLGLTMAVQQTLTFTYINWKNIAISWKIHCV